MAAGAGHGAAAVRHVDVGEGLWLAGYSARAAFTGCPEAIQPGDFVIAADGGWRVCQELDITPDLLLGDFDSLGEVPDFGHILRLPVEKDDTDMVRAVKEGLAKGEKEFHLLGGMGGQRSDHTVANMQTLAYLAAHGAKGVALR